MPLLTNSVNTIVTGRDIESRASYNHTSIAPARLHWSPILTPGDFSKTAVSYTSEHAGYINQSHSYREPANVEPSRLHGETNSSTRISMPAAGPTQTATSNLFPGLQSLPTPFLYQCSSCGRLNSMVPLSRADNDGFFSYHLPTSGETSTFQGFEMENESKLKKRDQ